MEGQKRTKLFLHLKKWLEKAVLDFGMIQKGDRLLVGVSEGADSLALLDLLNTPMLYIPNDFSILAVNVDLGFDPDYPAYPILEKYLRDEGYEYYMEKTEIGPFAHGEKNRKNPCFLCSRLRRKRLFEIAGEHGCNKVALAHHKDDIIETLMINILYGREISTMMPRQNIFGGKMSIIRPLAYIREELVKKYSRERGFPVTDTGCPTSRTSRRALVKKLLREFEKDNGNIRENIFKALRHVKPDYLPFPVEREQAAGDKMAKKHAGEKIIAQNKTAGRNYFIEEAMEAGIVLVGTEVKALREGKVNLKDSYVLVENGEVFVHDMHISPYSHGNRMNHEPLRKRKLLLHSREIRRLYGKSRERGLALFPLKLYFKNGRVKMELGVGKGKKLYDKREDMKGKDAKREMERGVRER